MRVRDDGRSARGKRLVIEAVARDQADISLEVYTAHERGGLLEDVLGRRVDVLGVSA